MIPDKVTSFLKKNGLSWKEFPEGSTPTAKAAADKLGVEVGQIAKSILFVGKSGTPYLVVCPGDRKVSPSKLKKQVKEKTRLATAEQTHEFTGFFPGGVCPFGIEGLMIIIDEELKEYDVVYPAAGTSGSAVKTNFEELVNLVAGAVADLTVPMNLEVK